MIDLLRLIVEVLRLIVEVLRLIVDLLKLIVEVMRLIIDLLKLIVDLLRLNFQLDSQYFAKILHPGRVQLYEQRLPPQPAWISAHAGGLCSCSPRLLACGRFRQLALDGVINQIIAKYNFRKGC